MYDSKNTDPGICDRYECTHRSMESFILLIFFQPYGKEILRKSLVRDCLLPREVFNELQRRDDNLWDWTKDHKKMFIELDEEQAKQVKAIVSKFPKLTDREKTTPDADPFVIGLALSKSWTVITSEHSNPGGKPRIPDVCKNYNIKCIKIVEFFRERGWRY